MFRLASTWCAATWKKIPWSKMEGRERERCFDKLQRVRSPLTRQPCELMRNERWWRPKRRKTQQISDTSHSEQSVCVMMLIIAKNYSWNKFKINCWRIFFFFEKYVSALRTWREIYYTTFISIYIIKYTYINNYVDIGMYVISRMCLVWMRRLPRVDGENVCVCFDIDLERPI